MRELVTLTPKTGIYLYAKPTDMRFGAERLAELASREVRDGGLFVFVSKNRKRVKLLYYDRDGLAVWYKTLDSGVFQVEKRNGNHEITAIDLKKLLRGTNHVHAITEKKTARVS